VLKACFKPLIYRLWKPKIESKMDYVARASRREPVPSGRAKFFLVWKVILEFSAGPSGWANLSVRTEAVRTLLGLSGLSNYIIFSKLYNDANFVSIRYLSNML
jgi:hypothetical protein